LAVDLHEDSNLEFWIQKMAGLDLEGGHCSLVLKIAWIQIYETLYSFEVKIIKNIKVIYGIWFKAKGI
jgi:hypothetical protein